MATGSSNTDSGYSKSSARRKRKSAFLFFMEDQRRTNPDARKDPKIISDLWQQLDDDLRRKYEKMAEDWNGTDDRVTAKGKTVRELKAAELERKQRRMVMMTEVELMVSEAAERGDLSSTVFHLVDFNIICSSVDGRFVPAEVAVVEVTLEEGIRKCLHAFLDPAGRVPLGCGYQAMRLAEETHNIPAADFALAEKDYAAVAERIASLVSEGTGQQLRLRLFCLDKEMDKIDKLLQELHGGPTTRHPFSLMSLPKLFFELQNTCVADIADEELLVQSIAPRGAGQQQQVNFPSLNIADDVLVSDEFEYTTANIGCHFHNALDSTRFCSLSKVARQAYVVLAHCCRPMGIDLLPGSHCPTKPGLMAGEATVTAGWLKDHLPKCREEVLNKALGQAQVRRCQNAFGSELTGRSAKAGHTPIPKFVDDTVDFFGPNSGGRQRRDSTTATTELETIAEKLSIAEPSSVSGDDEENPSAQGAAAAAPAASGEAVWEYDAFRSPNSTLTLFDISGFSREGGK